MATNTRPQHATRTPEHKPKFFYNEDLAYATPEPQPPQIYSLTGDIDNGQDVDGEYEEDDQDFLSQVNAASKDNGALQYPSMAFFDGTSHEASGAVAESARLHVDTPPPSDTTTPADIIPVTDTAAEKKPRQQKLILKNSRGPPGGAKATPKKKGTAGTKHTPAAKPAPKGTPGTRGAPGTKAASGVQRAPPSDSLATEPPATSRAGRRRQAQKIKPQDALMGSDYNEAFQDLSSSSGERKEEYIPSSPPFAQPVNRSVSRALHPGYLTPTPAEELQPSSDTVMPNEDVQPIGAHQETHRSAVADNNATKHPFHADISPQIHDLVDQIADFKVAHLPDEPTQGVWRAEHLTHMYISAYKSRHWHVCDLIADTWIRAFQAFDKNHPLWRPNKTKYVHTARDKTYGIQREDPDLDKGVCTFNATLLNNLYHHTGKKCGARLLWADAMALVGQAWEHELTSRKRQNQQWHPDLNWNVMCSALRLVRRDLTLKIEENTPENVWCTRYHVHTQHGLPCYREVARFAAKLEAERGQKRGTEEMEDVEMGPEQKRVSFGGTVEDFDSEEE